MSVASIDIVIPTIGRDSLAALLGSIGRARGRRPERIILADDRAARGVPLDLGSLDPDLRARIAIVPAGGHGPAAARNVGWRAARAAWVVFLDDDVVVDDDWLERLEADLASAAPDVAASYGRVRVPLPAGRKPTDWERNVAGLETAAWITADCAFRRVDLQAAGGFDERFPRAYREDSDIAVRTLARGRRLIMGRRGVAHPVRSAPWWISIRLQAGNADDALMTALHGRDWRRVAVAPRGAFALHAVAVGAAGCALLASGARRPGPARAAFALWLLLTARFAWRRIAPGPRTGAEIATMVATSLLIPFAAVRYRLVAAMRMRALLADRGRAPKPVAAAVLFDRDGTLIVDVPRNTDPQRVELMPAARSALEQLRAAGLFTAVISNQSGVAAGWLRRADVDAITARMEELLGPVGPVFICPHAEAHDCACRKPRPGLVHQAAAALGLAPRDCVVIGDIGADVEAAMAAGARSVLVPTALTLRAEIAAAPRVARDLAAAAQAVLSGAV